MILGSVGVFVFPSLCDKASPSSLSSPLVQKFPPCSPFFLSPVSRSKQKTAPPVLPPKNFPLLLVLRAVFIGKGSSLLLRMGSRGHQVRSSIGVALQGTPLLFSSCVGFWVFAAACGKREREE